MRSRHRHGESVRPRDGARRERGLSLVSLLIGMTISALGALTCTNILLNYQLAVAELNESSAHARQLSFGIAALERELLGAGFGIPDAGADDVAVITLPARAHEAASVAVLWRYMEGAAIVCRAIREEQAVHAGAPYRTLKVLESAADCDAGTPLGDLAFDDEIGTLGQWAVTDELAAYLAANETLFDITIATSSCAPYGAGAAERRLSVTVSAPSLAELHGAATSVRSRATVCLLNTNPS